MPHQDPAACPVHAELAARLNGLHTKLDLIVTAVCGDLSAQEPGLAERLRVIELKVRCLLGGLLAAFSCLGGIIAFIGAAKLVAALRCLFAAS